MILALFLLLHLEIKIIYLHAAMNADLFFSRSHACLT